MRIQHGVNMKTYMFWYGTKGEKVAKKLHLLNFHVDILTF